MIDSKIISLYNSFSIDNKRKLRRWINSDFVNKNNDIIKFFEFIDTRKNINEKSVTKQKAFQYIYPNSEYNDLRMRHLMWMTTEIVESFVVFLQTENNQLIRDQLLAKYYSKLQLYKPVNKILGKYFTKKDTLSQIPVEDYNKFYEAGLMYFDINSTYDRSKDYAFGETINSLTCHTIVECLKAASIADSIGKVTEVKIENPLLPYILDFLNQSPWKDFPTIRIYHHAYLFLIKEDETAFKKFIPDIREYEHLFNITELKRLYRFALNFCIKKHNQNQVDYTQKAFEIYLYTIEKGILIEGNEISRFVFTNVVTMGIRIRELDKVEDFIEKYYSFIHPDFRENTYDFNKTKLLYAKRDHKNALKILLTNEFKDEIWNLNAKFLTIKILFETQDLDSFEAYLKSFKKYVRRKNNIGYHQEYFLRACSALQTLYDNHTKPNKKMDFHLPEDTPDYEWFRKVWGINKPSY